MFSLFTQSFDSMSPFSPNKRKELNTVCSTGRSICLTYRWLRLIISYETHILRNSSLISEKSHTALAHSIDSLLSATDLVGDSMHEYLYRWYLPRDLSFSYPVKVSMASGRLICFSMLEREKKENHKSPKK